MTRVLRALARALLIAVGATVALVAVLRWVPPPTSAFMLTTRIASLLEGDFASTNAYVWQPMERISPQLAIAVIAAEDQRFALHAGFDFEAIRKAVRHNSQSARTRGASTISQQVAKNLFLWPQRSWLRKGLEAWFTVLLEALWPKERILEVYLNIAEFGPGTYGAQAAARKFFAKDAASLSRGEAATLAAVLPNPKRLRADRPSAYVQGRRDAIMGQMRALGGTAYLRQLRS